MVARVAVLGRKRAKPPHFCGAGAEVQSNQGETASVRSKCLGEKFSENFLKIVRVAAKNFSARQATPREIEHHQFFIAAFLKQEG
jgi:hypothetical protein